jgi:hypothetical protein
LPGSKQPKSIVGRKKLDISLKSSLNVHVYTGYFFKIRDIKLKTTVKTTDTKIELVSGK